MVRSKWVDFTVVGWGRFPLDMLRYDVCWPAHPKDVAELNRSLSGPSEKRTVNLTAALSNMPTEARWKSFGWVVTDIHKR